MWYALESGLDVGKALEMAAEVAGNGYVAEQLARCRQGIQQGEEPLNVSTRREYFQAPLSI